MKISPRVISLCALALGLALGLVRAGSPPAAGFGGLVALRTWREGEVSHLYRFPIVRGDFVRVAALQRSSDVVLEILRPGQTTPTSIDGLTYATGTDAFEWVAAAAGEVRVRVLLDQAIGIRPGYRLEISRPRPAGRREVLRAAAWADFHAGTLLRGDPGLAAHRRALHLAERAGATDLAARIHDRLGRRLPPDDPEALRHVRAAIALADEAPLRCLALHRLGNLLGDSERQGEAGAAFQDEYRVARRAGDRFREAAALSGVAYLAARRGRFEEAQWLERQAIRIWRELGDRSSQVLGSYALATISFGLGDSEQAMRDLEAGLALDVATPELKVDLLDSLAVAHRRLGHWPEAREAGEAAVEGALRLGDPARQAASLLTLGGMELDLGRTGKAAGYLRPAEAIYLGQVHDPASLANVRALLAAVAARDGDFDQAFRRFDRSLRGYRDLGDESSRAWVLSLRSEALRRAGRLEEAGADLETAIAIVESLRPALTPPGRATLVADRHRYFERLVDLRVEQGRPAAAFEASERARARTLLDEVSGLPAAPPRGLAEIRASLPPGGALVAFWLGEARSFVWVVRAQGVFLSTLPSAGAVEAASRAATVALGAPPSQVRATREGQVERLGRMLLGPIAPRLVAKRFLIVPDGVLFDVPFAALPVPAAPGAEAGRLIDRAPVVTLPSASLALEIRDAVARRGSAPGGLFAVGDPVFGCPDDRLACGPAAGEEPSLPERIAERVRAALEPAVAPARDLRGGHLPRIVRSGEEVAAIARLAEGQPVSARVGFAANRSAVLGAPLERYRILHFATHGFVDAVHPERSGLALARRDAAGAELPGDSFLRLGDLAGRKLNADLVSLSACDSALGRNRRGEGPQSLGRAFLAAGAANALVSLWRVDDSATEALMVEFYRRLLERKEPPASALRGAQLAVRSRPQWRDPYYWGAFVLQGD